MNNQHAVKWWEEEYGFFGENYLNGDNSEEGYLEKHKQTLKQRTLAEVNGVVSLLDLKQGQSVLDVPCGYGRHSIELAKIGIDVLGVELNSVHLKVAEKEARLAKVKIEFRKGDMIDLDFQEQFDVVINMFYSFGFFGSEDDNFKVLQNFYQALKAGGKFLFHTDVNVPRILQGKYKTQEIRHLVSGNVLKIVDNYIAKTKRINGAWIIRKANGKEIRKDYSVRVYTKDEFIDLCKLAGFVKFQTYADWGGGLYTEDSEDMIIVAQK